jgi:hypothetical protein
LAKNSRATHEKGIFPGTGNKSIPEKFAYNYPLGDHDGEGKSRREIKSSGNPLTPPPRSKELSHK